MPTFEDLFPNLPTMRSLLSQVPVLPFSKSSVADVLPVGIPFPDELLGFANCEEPEAEPWPPARDQRRRQSRVTARGGYRRL